jgi:hypothetical protein
MNSQEVADWIAVSQKSEKATTRATETLTRTTRDRVAKKASKGDGYESNSLLADEVGDKSNDGRRGAKVSMMVGRSSWDSFRYADHEYGDSKTHWPGEEGWNWEGEDGIERLCSR